MSRQIVHVVTRLGVEGITDVFDLQMCLNGQTDSNFQWIILLRPSAHSKFDEVKNQIKLTSELFSRTKILKVPSDSRGGILNLALNHCDEGMIVVLDDDDIPLSDYIEVINTYSKQSSYKSIIRTLVFSQETYRTRGHFQGIQISMSKGIELWPREFNLLAHIEMNRTPCMSISFPIRKLKNFGLRWDEELAAVEDWDFLVRSAQKIPVVSTPHVTALYRRSKSGYRSKSVTSPSKWRDSEQVVRDKIQSMKFEVYGSEFQGSKIPLAQNMNKTEIASPAPGFYRLAVRKILPLAIKFPSFYRYFRRVHNSVVKKFNWSL